MKEVTLWKMFVLTEGQNLNLRSVGWPGTDHYTDYTGFQHFVCLFVKKEISKYRNEQLLKIKFKKISSCWMIIEREKKRGFCVCVFTNIKSQDHSRWNPQHLRHDETIHCINTLLPLYLTLQTIASYLRNSSSVSVTFRAAEIHLVHLAEGNRQSRPTTIWFIPVCIVV